MQKLPIFILLIVSQVYLVYSCEKGTITPSENRIKRKVSKLAKEKNMPSLEGIIQVKSEQISFEYTNPDVNKQSVYGLASVTKLLSAVLIFKLIEEGELALNDTITNYISSIDHISGIENVTIAELLNHRSGLSDYSQHDTWAERVISGDPPISFTEKLLLVDSTCTNPGSFSYSNTNYLFLQEIVESVTDKEFSEAFDDFYQSIGIPGIKMGNTDPTLEAFFAQTEQVSQHSELWKEYHGFAGSAYSNSFSINTFLNSLFVEKSILNQASLSQMEQWTPLLPQGIPIGTGNISEYGNGIMKLVYNGREFIGHFGGSLKYQSFVFFNKKDQISISIMTNCSGKHYNNAFFQELIPLVLDELE